MERVHVMYVASRTVVNDWFTAEHCSSTSEAGGLIALTFPAPFGKDREGRKVRAVSYTSAIRAVHYVEDDE